MKKIAAIITALSLLSVVFISAYATETEAEPTIKITDAEVLCEQTVSVDMIFENNPGVMVGQFSLNYDTELLTYERMEINTEVGGSSIVSDGTLPVTVFHVFSDKSNNTFNGKYATVYFKTAAVTEDTVTEISIFYEEGDIWNAEAKNVAFNIVTGKITVKAPEVHEHTFSEWTVDENGHSRVCTDEECGFEEKGEHAYTEETVTKEATHLELGEKICKCICGVEKTEEIPVKTEHEYITFKNRMNDGHLAICVCDHEQILPHRWDNGEILKQPSHLEDGKVIFLCLDCGHGREENLPARADEHEFSEWTPVPGETIEDPSPCHTRECACGVVETEEHCYDDSEITIIVPPTHMQEGEGLVECVDCGNMDPVSIPKLEEHEFGVWNELDENDHIRECACGETEKAPHVWDEGKVTLAPTTETEGVFTYTCEECGATKTDDIPVLTYIKGDFTGDGSIDWLDLYAIFDYISLVEMDVTEEQLAAADYNGDGNIDWLDIYDVFDHISNAI